jgi:ribosomal protein L22
MIKADKGQYLKRVEFKARGRQGMRRKYRCHLTVRFPDGNSSHTMQRWTV